MIHIVTVYDSLNYGSYFQALALKNYLEKYDSTDYLDIHHQNLIKDTIISMARCIKHGRLNEAMALWKKLCVFKKSQSNFPTTDINDANKNDIYFFGSDEIWNLDKRKMKKNKEFFGKNIYSNNKIAYAPSVNTTSVDKFLNQSFYKDSLSKFIGVSVRDSHSKLVIEEVLNKDIPLVVDPTLLMPEEFYLHKMAKNNYLKSDYILIYSYGAMFKETHLKERIMSFAKEK